MTGGDRPDDELLLADLAAALRGERAVPSRFVELGRSAYTWHTIDAELAALIADTARAGGDPIGTRAEPAALRALTFVAGQVSIEIEVTVDMLLGQVAPPQPGELELRLRDGTRRTVPVDAVGWFRIRPRPTGPFQLHLQTTGGLSVITEWTTL